MHGDGEPSAWVQRFSALLPAGGSVLDVGCGRGRHMRWLAARGFRLTGVDRDGAALAGLKDLGETVEADLEGGLWPFAGRRFDGIVVANYLWRPLWPQLLASLAESGVYLHETFADGQQTIGKPSRPDFLLQPGELLRACAGLRTVAFEDGFEDGPGGGRFVQRIAAVAEAPGCSAVARHRLTGPAS